MSASMLRQMLEDAGALLKDQKYQQALDSSRRVTQFDPNNFQAFMCVGLANFHLQQWEDCEEAYRRAAGLKPDLPLAWKNLVDLFEERKQPQKKLEALEKLVAILQKNKKVKPCQKWIADVSATALELRMYPKAFNAWYSLVVAQGGDAREMCLDVTPNDEVPSKMAIWLDLVDLLQRPNFSLSDCATEFSQVEIAAQFFQVASENAASASATDPTVDAKLDAAVAYFMRVSLDELKAVSSLKSPKKKQSALRQLDAQALSILSWLPTAKIPVEYVLLRSEDQESPMELEKASQLARDVESVHPKSPMVQIFRGLRFLEANDTEQARESLLDALAYCSSSSFFESALCIRAQVELAVLALATRDVEGCLSRLQRAKGVLAEKAQVFGCSPPNPLVYSEAKVRLMEATASEYSGDHEKALAAYQSLINDGSDALTAFQATVRLSELLLSKSNFDETRAALDSFAPHTDSLSDEHQATVASIRGWVLFSLGSVDDGRALLEASIPKIVSVPMEKAKALKRLAIVYWQLDGAFRREKGFCFGHLLQAAKLLPSDSEIFGWLGKWYQEIAQDVLRAEKCFLKALSLSPGNETAGVALSDLYEQQGKRSFNVKLWEDMTKEPVSAPTWALLRLAQHLVESDNEHAVGRLHLVLRNDPLNARYWVTLGHVYRHFRKLVSAQKSYLKAVELGETSWCVMCELARIEGALLLFDEAFEHIEPFVNCDSGSSQPGQQQQPAFVVPTLYAELLFKQAKYLCAEGLYGRAAANLKKASGLMRALSSSSVEGLKLIGDIHCFAFYLAPADFESSSNGEPSGWVEFLSNGRKAYEGVAAIASSPASKDDFPPLRLAEGLYDVGLSCWYEAHALCNAHGFSLSGFEHLQAPQGKKLVASIAEHQPEVLKRVQSLKLRAKQFFADAVNASPGLALGWNGLGVVHDHVLLKQFAWTRAIQAESNSESAWANLGMLYVHQPDASSAMASLAQKALIHLQGVSANNPSMWNGYGMLARRDTSDSKQQQKAIEAFRCALEMGLDLDALQGFTTAILLNESDKKSDNSDEKLLFAMRKVLERDPFNAGAWNALGVLQQRLGLYEDSRGSFEQAQTLLNKTPWNARMKDRQAGLEWNASVAHVADKGDSVPEDTFSNAIAAAKASAGSSNKNKNEVLLNVLKAQQLFHQSNGPASLQVLTELLARSDITGNERDAVAAIGLSIAGLLLGSTTGGDQLTEAAKRVGTLCKEQLLSTVSTGITLSKLRVVEMHERAMGSDSDCVSVLEIAGVVASDRVPGSAWSRLAFALIDFQQVNGGDDNAQLLTRACAAARKYQQTTCKETADSAYLQALASLLLFAPSASSSSTADAQKLVRMLPWEPYAYFLAGAALLKSYTLASKSSDGAQKQQSTLEKAVLVLETGLRIPQSLQNHGFERAQLQWLLSNCYALLGDASRASQLALEAHDWIEGAKPQFPTRELEFELLDARLQAVASPEKSIAKYHKALTLVVSSSSSSSQRLVPILAELGAVYEAAGYDDCALQVWKSVASLTTAASSSSEAASAEAPEPPLGAFFANLRLALVHGKKQNTKTAKKQIKSTLALAPRAESKQATVVAFVEGVITKSS
ncbi:hypothetical protein Gpo141_00003072 [Globisporangium polare]